MAGQSTGLRYSQRGEVVLQLRSGETASLRRFFPGDGRVNPKGEPLMESQRTGSVGPVSIPC